MHFIGLDPSYNGFGIMRLDEEGKIVQQDLLSSNKKKSIEDRLIYLVDSALHHTTNTEQGCHLPNMVYVEGLAFSRNTKFAMQLAALHFMLRVQLHKESIPFKIITTQRLKKFVSGKGNCKKEHMLLNTYKKWGIEFEDHNLCDAYGLAQMAVHAYQTRPRGPRKFRMRRK